MRLNDSVVLITGSTTGIGAAMARRFAQAGARVILHGRDSGDEPRTQALRKEIGADRSAFVTGDLAGVEGVADLARAALACFGTLDALVNNAALTTRAHLEETDAAFFDSVIVVNLRAPLLLVRALLPELKRTQGCVLNIGSVLAHCGQSNLLAYSVSKGGLMTLTRNLGDALGPDRVRVNQLNVGWTLTENEYQTKLRDGLPENWPEQLPGYAAPSGRLLRPEDVAAAALYWISPASRPISGSVVDLEQYPVIGRIPNQEKK